MKDQQETQHCGVVVSFNVSPQGYPEGLLLQSEGGKDIVQFNFPPEAGVALTGAITPGDKVKATGTAEDDDRHTDHRVFRLSSITAGSHAITASGPDHARPLHTKGIVARINYAKHGEPNGAVLENGDFVHTKPHGAKAAKLKAGQQIEVTGHAWPMMAGGNVIEAETINGIELFEHKKEKHKENHGPKDHKHAKAHA